MFRLVRWNFRPEQFGGVFERCLNTIWNRPPLTDGGSTTIRTWEEDDRILEFWLWISKHRHAWTANPNGRLKPVSSALLVFQSE